MAKRKAARATGRKKTAAKRAKAVRPQARRGAATRAAGRTASASTGRGKTASRKSAKKTAKKSATPARASAKTARKATGRKTTARKATASKATARKASARNAAARVATRGAKAPARRRPASKTLVARKTPSLDRARRTVSEEDLMPPSPPSSLDMDRTASAARSGRRELRERLDEHNETSPAITAGDVDADWESAYSVGDEAPGGDNPTPDQDVVDDIGRAIGVQYEDNEELKGEKKISDRDRKRWELDPASAEDYGNHEED
jgi:hypothetical protein